jgi:hypothetical protein
MRFFYLGMSALGSAVAALLVTACFSWPVCSTPTSIGCTTPPGGFGGGQQVTQSGCAYAALWLCNIPQGTEILPLQGGGVLSVPACGGLICANVGSPDAAAQQAAALVGLPAGSPAVECHYVGTDNGLNDIQSNINNVVFTQPCTSKGTGATCNPCLQGNGLLQSTGLQCSQGLACCEGLVCTPGSQPLCSGTIGCSAPACNDQYNACTKAASNPNMQGSTCNSFSSPNVTLCSACLSACNSKSPYPSSGCQQCGFM